MRKQKNMNKKRLSRVFWIFLISMMSLLFRSCISPNMIFANAINHDELTKQLVVKSPIVMEMEKFRISFGKNEIYIQAYYDHYTFFAKYNRLAASERAKLENLAEEEQFMGN